MNPILLYELRQSVRNRSVLVAIVLYLAAMIVLTAVVMTNAIDLDHHLNIFLRYWVFGHGDSSAQKLITALFRTYYVFATTVLIGFGAVKIAIERLNGDLLYTSPLTPGRITWGKVQLGVVISLLFGSMTLPFLAAAYLNRGIDVLGIFLTFLLVFALTQIHYSTTVAMFAGAISLSAVFARLLPWFLGQSILFILSIFLIASGQELDFREVLPGLMGATLVFCTISYLLATAQFAPESANRMFAVRVGLTVLFGVFLVVGVVYTIFDAPGIGNPSSALFPWLVILFFVLSYTLWLFVPYLFLVFICERTELSHRQRQQIPQSLIGRLVAFPFYSGVANAMVWSVGLVLFGILFLIVADDCSGRKISTERYNPFYGLFTFSLLFFNYCATSLLVCKLLLRRWMTRRWYWVPVCALVGTIIFAVIASVLAHAWFTPFRRHSLWEYLWNCPFLPYPWSTWEKDLAYQQYIYGEIWLALLCVVGLPWVIAAFRRFRRSDVDSFPLP